MALNLAHMMRYHCSMLDGFRLLGRGIRVPFAHISLWTHIVTEAEKEQKNAMQPTKRIRVKLLIPIIGHKIKIMECNIY